MKAVILVGGEGTRLRPLSCDVPKPMMPIANKPFIEYIINQLKKYSIKDIIFSTCYLPEHIENYFGDGSDIGISITYITEEQPLGTAGAVKNVEEYLKETFLVFNGDILTDLNLDEIIEYHLSKKSKATIALTAVEDPTIYGLVELSKDNTISSFLEKPSWDQVTSNLINAGTYVLEPDVLNYIPKGKNYSFERGLFPALLEQKEPMFGFISDSYWLDIGTPAKYILAHHDILEGKIDFRFEGKEIKPGVWIGKNTEVDSTVKLASPSLIGSNCRIESNVKIAGLTAIGNNCSIKKGSHLEGCVILDDCKIEENAIIENSILGKGVFVGKKVYIGEGAVIGGNCAIEEGNHLSRGIKIWPSTRIEKDKIRF
ncbi:MAG: NDP-sugar synthase [Actinobacteria bacterium]|nr:NDP-sugar synthase [Actinomycetota bacterium]